MNVIVRLANALRCLPGVGPKSAQRMIFHLLQHQRQHGLYLAACLEEAMRVLGHCNRCNNYTEFPLCKLCQNTTRNLQLLCVVETPADVDAIEQSNAFNGCYYVLMGKISPLDGIGPEELHLEQLQKLIINENIQEVILALNPSLEGHTTVYFIFDLLKELPNVKITQLAHGIPTGGELEFLDPHTIRHALLNRSKLEQL